MDEVDADWNRIWELDNRVQQGELLILTEEVRNLLRRMSPTVAIDEAEAEAALSAVASATALLQKIQARIRDGSRRLSKALHRMYELRNSEDFEGARQQMRDLLAVEAVPFYRDIAAFQLEQLNKRF